MFGLVALCGKNTKAIYNAALTFIDIEIQCANQNVFIYLSCNFCHSVTSVSFSMFFLLLFRLFLVNTVSLRDQIKIIHRSHRILVK